MVRPGFPPVSFIWCSLVVVVLGCYVTKHGFPARSAGYIKWETRATSFAQRGAHVLLFSSQFIEIRNTANGLIVQVIEGTDIRLLYASPFYADDEPVLVAMRGDKDDKDGRSEKIVELVETSEYSGTTPVSQLTPRAAVSGMWDEWEM
jgi:RHO1 GDP-GTP exchange protein 1/2